MIVQVQLFAGARDRAGTDVADLKLPEDATVSDVREALCAQFEALQPIAGHLLVAVDDAYATDRTSVSADSRIACFPPVSGG